MIAIPAIDLIDGQVVRLFQGDFDQQTTYTKNPVDYAIELEKLGVKFLHLVDLSGAKAGELIHTSVLVEMTNQTQLKIDFGGGVKTKSDVETILKAGANQVVIGSLCAKNPEIVRSWIEEFGADRFVLALDTDGIHLKINGWQKGSGLTLDEVMFHFSSISNLCILTTDIRRDGTGNGPSIELYTDLVNRYPNQHWIASGGVESMSDLEELRSIGCYACVVGKALLDGKISISELTEFNNGRV